MRWRAVYLMRAVPSSGFDELGLISSSAESEGLANSVKDNGGVYLVSAFTGLGAPYWDMYARGCIMGLTRGSTKAHIVRAALEGVAYQVRDLLDTMGSDAENKVSMLRVDGDLKQFPYAIPS